MRLICTISSEEHDENPYEFSYFLTSQKIPNECEEVTPVEKGAPYYRIWVYDEDHVERATQFYQEYRQNPHAPRFRAHDAEAIRIQEKKLLGEPSEEEEEEEKKEGKVPPRRRRFLSPAPYGRLSTFILLISILLFVLSFTQKGIQIAPKWPNITPAPLLPHVDKALVFDYPAYFELRDQLLPLYTAKDLEEKKPPSAEALAIIKKLQQTSFWTGFYTRIVAYLKDRNSPIAYHGPLFEKIKKGEVWRLLSPVLLHFDFLHIFFNVLWFILLANQIEYRIGSLRYLFLISAVALISNLAQYAMSGPFFMGLSGIICGLAGFIWARQQVAPWEGYLLHRVTLIFLLIFVLGIFALQTLFFFLQIFGVMEQEIPIANTAHLVGGTVGYLLGRWRFFALHQKST